MDLKRPSIYVAKTLLIQVVLFVLIVASIWGFQKLYAMSDEVSFPDHYEVTYSADMTDTDKGIQLLDALLYRMRYELGSTYGWTANDILFHPIFMDNRAYRQFGVYNATKMLYDNYSLVIAKLGNADRENDDLYKARLNGLAFSPSRWGILFIPSAEQAFNKALKLSDKYKADLLAGTAVYNARTDDIYSAFNVILGETVFGHALGLLQNSQDMSFYELDNRIYEVQGMMLVVRDYVSALYTLYPEIAAKGNEENYAEAMELLDKICTYDPLYITSTVNSGELIVSYLLFARNRLSDIRDSIRI